MHDLLGEIQPIKIISLWQPWASLIALGFKRHETRHWRTDYRGPLAIHAARKLDPVGAPEDLCRAAMGPNWRDRCPLGAVVAVTQLSDIHRAEVAAARTTRADLASGNFTVGRFAWDLRQVRPLIEPIPLTGRQGLFSWPPPVDLEALLGPVRDHRAEAHRMGWA